MIFGGLRNNEVGVTFSKTNNVGCFESGLPWSQRVMTTRWTCIPRVVRDRIFAPLYVFGVLAAPSFSFSLPKRGTCRVSRFIFRRGGRRKWIFRGIKPRKMLAPTRIFLAVVIARHKSRRRKMQILFRPRKKKLRRIKRNWKENERFVRDLEFDLQKKDKSWSLCIFIYIWHDTVRYCVEITEMNCA